MCAHGSTAAQRASAAAAAGASRSGSCTAPAAHPAWPPRRRLCSGALRRRAALPCCRAAAAEGSAPGAAAAPPLLALRRRHALLATAGAAALAALTPPRAAAAAASATLPPSRAAADEALRDASFDQVEAFAKTSYEARELDGALAALTEIIRREPQTPVWYERRAQVLVDLKQFAAALTDFDAAVARQPPGFVSLGLLANRALAREGLSDWAGAAADYTAAINLSRGVGFDAPYLLNGRGNARVALAEYEGALADFREASAVFQSARNLSGVIFADSNAALVEAQLGRDEDATAHMAAVARRAAGSIDMRAALAAQRWALGQPAEAEAAWDWACTSNKINSGVVTPGGPSLDGCALYRDDDWVRRIRRWPPVMATRLADFLALRAPTRT
jgi:tetratricopeptide (TPR) repeat protein